MSGSGFVLGEKGELYANFESTYGTTPAASTLGATNVQNLSAFKTKVVPTFVSTEDEGGGVTPGVVGQTLLKVSEHVEYSGTMPMREFSVPITDTGARPSYDIWLRAGGFLEGVYDLADRTVIYDMALAGNGESIAYAYREWIRDGGRKLHYVQGGRHSTKISFKAGAGTVLEITDGKALSYSSPANVAASDFPPSMTLNGGTSQMVWNGTTVSLLAIGGSTYAGAVTEVNIIIPTRTEMLPGPDAGGFCEAFSNPIKPSMEIVLYEVATGLEIRDAFNDAETLHLSFTTQGPGTSANTLNVEAFFMIESLSEESGPSGTKMVKATCKLLYRDDSAPYTEPGIDPSLPPVRITLAT